MPHANDPTLQWMLKRLVAETSGVTRAIWLSADGILLGSSSETATDDDAQLAAVAASAVSLSSWVAGKFDGGRMRQSVIEYDEQFMLFTTAGEHSCLAVQTTSEADIGLVSQEMNLLVAQVGDHLGTAVRDRADNDPSNATPSTR